MGQSKNPAKSGNPAKRAAAKAAEKASEMNESEELVVSDVSSFKARAKGRVMKLPSGMVAKLKRVDLQDMIISGNVHNPLMSVVSEALEKGQKADIPKMMGMDDGEVDLSQVRDMFEMVNHVMVGCFVEPEVHPMPIPLDDDGEPMDPDDEDYDQEVADLMEEDLLYVNEIDPDDKMFIFGWCVGGTDDVATFRREARTDMDALAKGKGGKRKTKRAAGASK